MSSLMFLCSVGGCADCTAAARRSQPSGLGGALEEMMRARKVSTDKYNIIHSDDSLSVPTPPPTTCGTLEQSSSVSTQSQLSSTFIRLYQVGYFFPVTLEEKWLFRNLWLRSRIRAQKSQPAFWGRTALGPISVNISLCPILIPNVQVTLSALID